MALTRNSLKVIGLTSEQIESIIEMHSDTVNAYKEQLKDANEIKSSYEKLKADYEKLSTEHEAAKRAVSENAQLKEQYETTKAEYEKFKTDTETKAAKAATDAIYTKWLKGRGYPDKVAAKIVKSGEFNPEFDEHRAIKNEDKLSEEVDAEWGDFKAKERTEGAKTETPPTNTGGNTITREDILKIPNTAERQKAIAENGALFGIK